MRPGDQVELAGYTIVFDGAKRIQGPNYQAVRGIFAIRKGAGLVTRLHPEKRSYPAEGSETTEAGIHTTWLADIYVVLGDPNGKGAFSTRLYHNPLIPWIWFGAVTMALGGLISLTDRRLRIGAPRRKRLSAPSGASPALAGPAE